MVKLVQFFEATNDNTLSGGAGILVYAPSTGHILVQVRGEHPDDKDSGKYDFFGGTLEEGETSEECARREAYEEGGLEFPEGAIKEIGTFSSTEGGDWDGEPYHVFIRVVEEEFPVKVDKEEVAKAAWVGPKDIDDKNSTSRLIKAIEHLNDDTVSEARLCESIPKTLYHGTSLPRAKKILQHGLEPQVGGLVNQFYGDEEEELEPLAFAADKQDLDAVLSAMISAIESDYGERPDNFEEMIKRGALVIMYQGEDEFYKRKGEDDSHDDYEEHPVQVEPGDYYSHEGSGVDAVLSGRKLRNFLKSKLGPNASIGFHFDSDRKYDREMLIKLLVKDHPNDPIEGIVKYARSVPNKNLGRMIFDLRRNTLESIQHNNLGFARYNELTESFLNTSEDMYWYNPSSNKWIDVESAHTWEAIDEIGIPEPEDWEPGEDWEIIEAAVRKGWVRISYFNDRKVLHITAANGNLLRKALMAVSEKYPVIKSMWYEILRPSTSEEYFFRNPGNPLAEF